METPPRICGYRHCSAELTGNDRQIYCDRQHKQREQKCRSRDAASKVEKPPRWVTRDCVDCGEEFAQLVSVGRQRSRCPRCDTRPPTYCEGCNKRLHAPTRTGKCRGCTPRKPKPAPKVITLCCPNCKTIFEGPSKQVFCSAACAKQLRRRVIATAEERFRDEEIYERDGWICQLCDEPIDRSLYSPEPRSRSIDHKTPISRGGLHTRENTQAAHLGCNGAKSNQLLAAS